MARNKLTDLNNHLFASLERLGDEEIKGENLEEEIKRAKSIADTSKQIINNARLTIDAVKFASSGKIKSVQLDKLTGVEDLKLLDR